MLLGGRGETTGGSTPGRGTAFRRGPPPQATPRALILANKNNQVRACKRCSNHISLKPSWHKLTGATSIASRGFSSTLCRQFKRTGSAIGAGAGLGNVGTRRTISRPSLIVAISQSHKTCTAQTTNVQSRFGKRHGQDVIHSHHRRRVALFALSLGKGKAHSLIETPKPSRVSRWQAGAGGV